MSPLGILCSRFRRFSRQQCCAAFRSNNTFCVVWFPRLCLHTPMTCHRYQQGISATLWKNTNISANLEDWNPKPRYRMHSYWWTLTSRKLCQGDGRTSHKGTDASSQFYRTKEPIQVQHNRKILLPAIFIVFHLRQSKEYIDANGRIRSSVLSWNWHLSDCLFCRLQFIYSPDCVKGRIDSRVLYFEHVPTSGDERNTFFLQLSCKIFQMRTESSKRIVSNDITSRFKWL